MVRLNEDADGVPVGRLSELLVQLPLLLPLVAISSAACIGQLSAVDANHPATSHKVFYDLSECL
jgi:hypothetical protein